jgi:hypothetical protein
MTADAGTASGERLAPAHEGFATPSGQLLAPVSSRRRAAPVGISLGSRLASHACRSVDPDTRFARAGGQGRACCRRHTDPLIRPIRITSRQLGRLERLYSARKPEQLSA